MVNFFNGMGDHWEKSNIETESDRSFFLDGIIYFVSFTCGFVKGIYFDRITLGRKPKMTTCFSSYLMDVNRKLVQTATAD